jgi:hypothetical protein
MQVTDEPPALRKRMPAGRTLPQGFENVVNKCLAKDSGDRFTSMEDVRAALERIAGGGVPLVAPPSSQEDTTDSFIDELQRDTDFRELHAGGRRRRWVARGALLLALAGAGAAAFLFLRPRFFPREPTLPRPAPNVVATTPEPVPSPTATAAPAPAPAPANELVHVALILFPLNSHVFDGDKDLGMMPITIDLVPGETKVVRVVRKGYVTRTLKLDGSKTRIVVGLVSEAAAAKHRGKSQEDAEAEADRAAATLAADETTAEAPTGEVEPAASAAAKSAKATRPTEKAAAEKAEPGERPVPPPAPKRSSKMLAPNPFGD